MEDPLKLMSLKRDKVVEVTVVSVNNFLIFKIYFIGGGRGGDRGGRGGGRGAPRGGANLDRNDIAAKKGSIVAFEGEKKSLGKKKF